MGPRLQNPLALRAGYNAKPSAPSEAKALQPRSPNSVAPTARIVLNFSAQNQAGAWGPYADLRAERLLGLCVVELSVLQNKQTGSMGLRSEN